MSALGLRGGRTTYQAALVLVLGIGLVIACGSSDDTPSEETPDGGVDGSITNPPPGSGQDGSTTNPPPGSACAVNTCATNLKCDATLGCVVCVNDGDCATNTRSPFCVLGRCEACKTNADCGAAAPACYPGDHQCHTACNVDGGARCNKGTPICDATGACIGCNSATDCRPEAPICEPTTKSCVKCAKDADCPAAANKCSPTRFECVDCVTNADCPTGQRCGIGNRCVPGCTTNDQCTGAEAKICDVPTGNCVQCLSPTDCAGTAAPICGLGHRCVQCNGGSDCSDGGNKFCHDAKCVQCRNDNDCPGPNGNCDNDVCK